MTDVPPRARSRARNRAIREYARQAGVPFSEAARQLDYAGVGAGETLANHGRTIYPTADDHRRRSLVEARLLRSRTDRVADARRAARLPGGRAAHLVDRFPPGRGVDGSGVGPLYAGPIMIDALALLYLLSPRRIRPWCRSSAISPGSRSWGRRLRSTPRAPRSTARFVAR